MIIRFSLGTLVWTGKATIIINYIVMNKIINLLSVFCCIAFIAISCEKNPPKFIPTITTTVISSITSSSATGGGSITGDGGSVVTSRGVCWSLNHNPNTSDNKTSDGGGIGSFTSTLAGLTENTTYYVRSYATNAIGTSYGNEISFVTPMSYPGTSLPPLKIGYTWWAPVNVGYDGNHIYGLLFQWGRKYGQGYNTSETPGLTIASGPVGIYVGNNPSYSHMFFTSSSDWCSPQSSSWDMILNNPCPTGWRVPTSEEFQQLFNIGSIWSMSGGPNNIPGRWFGPDYATGGPQRIFLPAAGIRLVSGTIGDVNNAGRYWTETPNLNLAFHLYFNVSNAASGIASNGMRGSGISLRCVRN